jgi:lipoate-protein ligase A
MIAWRLIDSNFINPYFNMALEEAIAKAVGEELALNTIRFWRNDKSVILGRFQSLELEVDLNACIKHNVAVVRRFTGGGAVYHDLGNLNYSIALNKKSATLKEAKNIQAFFMKSALSVIEGLKILGLTSTFKKPNIVLVEGRKVSGAAGAIRWNTIFHHGCILVSSNLLILREVLNCFKESYACSKKWVSSRKIEVANINEFMNKEVNLNEVKNALKKGFEKVYRVKLIEDSLSLKELKIAEALYKNKYCRHEWNYKGVEL